MNSPRPISQSKLNYEVPIIEIIQLSCSDIIAASGNGDFNQGEWDPQTIEEDITVKEIW